MNSILLALVLTVAAPSPPAAKADKPTGFADPQTAAAKDVQPQKTPEQRLAAVSDQLDAIDKDLAQDKVADTDLAKVRAALAPLQDEVAAVISELTPQAADLKARLDELGKPPAEGQPAESSELASERRAQTKRFQEIEDTLKRAHVLELRLHDIADAVAKHRRELFSAQLSARTPSLFGVSFWRTVTKTVGPDHQHFVERAHEGRVILEQSLAGEVTHVVIVCIAGLVLALLAVTVVDALVRRVAARFLPDNRLRRTLVGFASMLVTTIGPYLGATLVADDLRESGALSPFMVTVFATAVAGVRVTALMHGLSRAWLAPGLLQWRLVDWSDEQVNRLRWMPLCLGVAVSLRLMWERTNDALGTSLPTAVLGRTGFALLTIAVYAMALVKLGHVRQERQDRAQAGVKPPTLSGALLTGVAWAVIAVALVAIIAGYNALAFFLVRELVQVSIVIAGLRLLVLIADDLFMSVLSDSFPVGHFLRRAVGLANGTLNQTAAALTGVARVFLVYIAVRLVLMRMGGEDVTSVAGRIQDGLTDLKVGEVTISPGAIIGALLVFSGVLFLTRTVRRWLESNYLPHTTLDSGARNSLSTGIGYLGFVAAVLLAVAYLGVSLDKVALIASALSVGVGFGLQAIISNFVSGLILLVERPIKVGDLVSVAGSTGDVRKISVRATEIQLGDGSTFVVPNSDLISKPVVNKTRIGVRGQVQFLLRVAYGADPSHTRDLILAVIADNHKVLKDPAPGVFIDDVDDRGYVFNVSANIASPRDTYGVRSDLFFAITKRLRTDHVALGSPIASVEGEGAIDDEDDQDDASASANNNPPADPQASSDDASDDDSNAST